MVSNYGYGNYIYDAVFEAYGVLKDKPLNPQKHIQISSNKHSLSIQESVKRALASSWIEAVEREKKRNKKKYKFTVEKKKKTIITALVKILFPKDKKEEKDQLLDINYLSRKTCGKIDEINYQAKLAILESSKEWINKRNKSVLDLIIFLQEELKNNNIPSIKKTFKLKKDFFDKKN